LRIRSRRSPSGAAPSDASQSVDRARATAPAPAAASVATPAARRPRPAGGPAPPRSRTPRPTTRFYASEAKPGRPPPPKGERTGADFGRRALERVQERVEPGPLVPGKRLVAMAGLPRLAVVGHDRPVERRRPAVVQVRRDAAETPQRRRSHQVSGREV